MLYARIALLILIAFTCIGLPTSLSPMRAERNLYAATQIIYTLDHPYFLARCSTTEFRRADLLESVALPIIDTDGTTSLRVKVRPYA